MMDSYAEYQNVFSNDILSAANDDLLLRMLSVGK